MCIKELVIHMILFSIKTFPVRKYPCNVYSTVFLNILDFLIKNLIYQKQNLLRIALLIAFLILIDFGTMKGQ
jgi:hypothetical protein